MENHPGVWTEKGIHIYKMPRGRGIRRIRQQNPYGGVGRGQVRSYPGRDNREHRNPSQQARQEADVPQYEPELFQQAPILNPGQQIATRNVGVQADYKW